MKFKCFLLLTGLFLLGNAFIQTGQAPFRKEIDAFLKKDSLEMPAKHSILLIGSSSFAKWTDVQDYFPGYPILNRGFGGASLPDLIRYTEEIVFPYAPKQVIVYCGENDIAFSDAITAKMVLERFQQLFLLIRNKLPKVPFVFISIKPSPSRLKFQPVVKEANFLIKHFLSKEPKTTFINVYDAMLNTDGSMKEELFINDQLHMNAGGYSIWQKLIFPYLIK